MHALGDHEILNLVYTCLTDVYMYVYVDRDMEISLKAVVVVSTERSATHYVETVINWI